MIALTAERRAAGVTDAVELVGTSDVIARVQEFVRRAATLDGSVLITAEPGIQSASIAFELYAAGRFAGGPFVAVECGAYEAAHLDRVLFGTGAEPSGDLECVAGDSRIAAARGGVLFLENVADLPAAAQTRLARIARDGEMRVDGAACDLSCRFVASATPGLDGDVEARRFRSDLYRRLSSIRIDLPPLRERPDDVPALAQRLLDDVCRDRAMARRVLTQSALALVSALTWPGNLAELRHAIVRVVEATREEVVQVEHLLPVLSLQRTAAPTAWTGTLREARLRFEREYIASVLQRHGWRMASAAQSLGIQRPNLYRKARQLGIPLARSSE